MPIPAPCNLVIAVLITLATVGRAQTGEPATAPANSLSLAALKAKFLEEMRREMSPAAVQYVEELKKLERKFAAAGKFEAAIAARDERLAVVRFLEESGGAAPEVPVASNPDKTTEPDAGPVSPLPQPVDQDELMFDAMAADVSEGATSGKDGVALGAAQATASWKLGTFEPGGYEVVITYTSTAATRVQARESFFRLSADLPSSGGVRKSHSIGILKITGRSEAVSLVHTGEEEGLKLTIHAIQLISSKE